ncbi:MAG: AI-2E family transporter [Thermomicrobiales bacterium]
MVEERMIHSAPGPTPIPISPRTRAILIGVACILLLLAVRALPELVLTALAGATLALILSFPVNFLARYMRRGWAILLSYLLLIVPAAAALTILIPVLISQISALINNLPQIGSKSDDFILAVLQPLHDRGFLPGDPNDILNQLEDALSTHAQEILQTTIGTLASVLSSAVGVVFQAFGVIFISAYLLADIRRFKAAYLVVFPSRYRDDALALWNETGQSLSRYLAGLVVSITIQGVLATVFLSIIGVPYAILLGVWMSLTAILPYIGAWLGAIPAVTIALFISFPTAIYTGLSYLAINMIEGNLLTPRIQGEAVKAHPILVYLVVIGGSTLFGLTGAVFAVPALALARVLFDFLRARLVVIQPE